jgi:hypothetical protein
LAFPPIDLSCSDRALKQRPGPANGFFQLRRINPDSSAGRALQSRDYFPVQAAMMFLCAFLYSRCKSAGTFFKVMLAIVEP